MLIRIHHTALSGIIFVLLVSLFLCGETKGFEITEMIFTSESPPDNCRPPTPQEGDFTIYDYKVYLWIDWTGYEAGTVYRYEWYNPEDELAYVYETSRDNDSDGCSWCSISSQRLFNNGGGKWTVVFYYDDVPQCAEEFTFEDPGDFDYMFYLPDSFEEGNGILIPVHGAGYNPVEYYHFFKPTAELYGVALIVPYFSEDEWPGYNRLFTSDFRADTYLQHMIDEVVLETGADSTELYLYGQSGGGQFVHRYMLAHPENIHRIVISAPGWWTFPREDWFYAYGLGYIDVIPDDIVFDLGEVNPVRKKVMVGEFDTERDPYLNQSYAADLQGLNRVQRSAHWVNRMILYSFDNELDHTTTRYEIISGADHGDVRRRSIQQIQEFLFQEYPVPEVVGAIQINDDADTTSSFLVELTIKCQSTEGCGQVAIDTVAIDSSYTNYQEVEWEGEAGDLQTATISYSFLDEREGIKFIFGKVKNQAMTVSDGFGDVIVFQRLTGVPPEDKNATTTPEKIRLFQNYPNPFNPSTTINYELPKDDHVQINIYNPKGELIRELIDEKAKAGQYSIRWNGKNNNGKDVSSGIYFYQMQAGGDVSTKKVLLLK